MTISNAEFANELDNLLRIAEFNDYCPNGLQVEGKEQIRCLVSGVTASQALIDAAIQKGADALLVHHGFFWRGEEPRVVGMKRRRLAALLRHDINLFAYHLPLDAHPTLGNNAQLAERLGFISEGGMESGPLPVGNVGRLAEPLSAEALAEHVGRQLGRPVLLEAVGDKPVSRIAWCTGGAQSYIEKAAALGVDAYLTGEVSEPTIHVARELGIHFIAAGHHATERYGAKAVGEYMARRHGLEHHFIDIDNPA
ncbi:Nif3-like dinuclear metal center hexameric protein [Spongiibacter taiwanensis]|uniref:Nif3-like dinuclear metal center hexameric protein n=1 Tax=Spongiibacter taiwanensis TaxID=1748242 RepID=UPI002034FAB6|nr:Nif3-like dinuclear metal center hexameric protein [Spongiibacter taiwanensis]USA44297.1 Nif3-like dinuclear metal center hexameric protein [Spongiibacter taiwanensis]